MNEMLLNNNRNAGINLPSFAQSNNDQAPKASERIELVQRFRDRNQSHRRRENLFGCVMH